MLETHKYMISYFLTYCFLPVILAKITNCDEGHLCSSNRECCSQGCCPTQIRVATSHVLNLFLINHWYFWCLIVALILAFLCAYSLWKKRRQFCGWHSSDNYAQSEGDSAGSCYAPPQYSRCSSFHRPPPYSEVKSKPDLYPLVFTCNTENGKNGTSYLMVQYFKNYIVRPANSISATSTFDSLSSSFIFNSNDANTLIPPPYSRATSPEIPLGSHFQSHYILSGSTSQTVLNQNNSHIKKIVVDYITNDSLNQNGKNMDSKIQPTSTEKKELENINDSLTLMFNKENELKKQELHDDIFQQNNYVKKKKVEINRNQECFNFKNNEFKNSITSNQFVNQNKPTCKSCSSVSPISISKSCASEFKKDCGNIGDFRKSFDTCYQILNNEQFTSSLISNDINFTIANDKKNSENNKFLPLKYLNTNICSVLNSLTNLDSPISEPQEKSPTKNIISNDEDIKDVLNNIRQIEIDENNMNRLVFNENLIRPAKERPSGLSSNEMKILSQNNSLFMPMWNPNIKRIKNPINRNHLCRGPKYWISKSAPTTPATIYPADLTDNLDLSPLLQQNGEEFE